MNRVHSFFILFALFSSLNCVVVWAADNQQSTEPTVTKSIAGEVGGNDSEMSSDQLHQEKTAVADENAVVCKAEKVTGSNLKRRVCRSKAEIDEARDASRRALEQSNRNTSASFGK